MGNTTSVSVEANNVGSSDNDGWPDMSDFLKKMTPDKREAALETKIKDGDDFASPLIIAAGKGQLDFVKVLLRSEVNIEARGTVKIGEEVLEGCTPLLAATAKGHLDVVRLLIRRNAKVDSGTPLKIATFDGRLDSGSRSVENGTREDAYTTRNNTPLMIASYKGHADLVSYLVEHGANTNLQDKNGDTCLHFAARRGNVEVVGRVLALGAKQKKNRKGLTPLLESSNDCKVEMVEYFIIRPECTKEQRIDALELLGASIANDCHGVTHNNENAFDYMERGMKERYEDQAHPLLKMETKPVKAYQNRRESQTLQELALLNGDDLAVRMEGLLIRERILGTENTMLLDNIRYSGSVFAESQQFEVCVGLWIRAMEIATNGGIPVAEDVGNCTDLFAEMVQRGHRVESKIIDEVIEKLVDANEKLTGKLRSGKSQKGHEKEEQQTLLFYALYLLMIYTKVQDPLEMVIRLQRFLRLNPRTRDGNTLLHLAVWHKTPVHKARVKRLCKLPCVEIIKVILLAGCDVNAVNEEGNTPLHLAVTFKPEPEERETLTKMLQLLLVNGAFTKLVNSNHLTAMECCRTEEARMIVSRKPDQSAMEVNANDEVSGSSVYQGREAKFVFAIEGTLGKSKEVTGRRKVQEKHRKQREKTQQLTNAPGQGQGRIKEITLESQLRAKEQEVKELEISLSTTQQALLTARSHQQSPDWVIPRNQIQLTDKILGKGGWGSVVEGKYCGCAVAVKQMYEVILSDHNRRLFEREMSIASRCRHPCLLLFIGATNDEGSPLFVTELMESSLRALLEQRPLSNTEVSVISLDVARALNYLHKKPSPIIHRDISSANVLLWREAGQWRGKVSDYGTANFTQDSRTACPGSRIYSAPEALTGNQTAKVDVYSYGVLLCEICIREQPEPERRKEQVAMVENRARRRLIWRCLNQDPEGRPSMEEIIVELEQPMSTMFNWF